MTIHIPSMPIPPRPSPPSRSQFQPISGAMACPTCLETLTRQDLEGFGRCPYCDHAFKLDSALEDFLLAPVIRQWSEQAHIMEAD